MYSYELEKDTYITCTMEQSLSMAENLGNLTLQDLYLKFWNGLRCIFYLWYYNIGVYFARSIRKLKLKHLLYFSIFYLIFLSLRNLKYLKEHRKNLESTLVEREQDRLVREAVNSFDKEYLDDDHVLIDEDLVTFKRTETETITAEPMTESLTDTRTLTRPPTNFSKEYLKTYLKKHPGIQDRIQKSLTIPLGGSRPLPTPPNQKFYFFNKMPKSGSISIKYLLKELASKNSFDHLNIRMDEGLLNKYDETVKYISERYPLVLDSSKKQKPLVVLQQQNFINFTDLGIKIKPPTSFTIARNPIDRFISQYYSCRFGTKSNPGPTKLCQNLPKNELNLSVTDFFNSEEGKQLSIYKINYLNWICGNYNYCKLPVQVEKSRYQRSKLYNYAKRMVLINYYVIGVMERFEDSLRLFEIMMPNIFRRASVVYSKSYIQASIESSKSLRNSSDTSISNNLRAHLERTTFSHDMDLYTFIYAKFSVQYEKFVRVSQPKFEAL